MRRFFVNPNNLVPGESRAYIEGEDVHHIYRVLRLQPGDGLILLDGLGNEYQARIVSISPGRVETAIENKRRAAGEPNVEVILLQGIAKGDKMELIIQKCTELGIKAVRPVVTSRTVVKLPEKKKAQKQKRWQRVAQEAAKQCRRPAVPEVAEPCTFKQALERLNRDTLILMPWEEEESVGIKSVLAENEPRTKTALLIGPEGGWTSEEVAGAKEHGAVTVRLGPRILRTETAGMAALTMILYAWADLGG